MALGWNIHDLCIDYQCTLDRFQRVENKVENGRDKDGEKRVVSV